MDFRTDREVMRDETRKCREALERIADSLEQIAAAVEYDNLERIGKAIEKFLNGVLTEETEEKKRGEAPVS